MLGFGRTSGMLGRKKRSGLKCALSHWHPHRILPHLAHILPPIMLSYGHTAGGGNAWVRADFWEVEKLSFEQTAGRGRRSGL